METFVKCGLCSELTTDVTGTQSVLRACSSGCGLIAHLSCFPPGGEGASELKPACPQCLRNAPLANSSVVLARMADITNLCLLQSSLIVELSKELRATQSDLKSTKEQVLLLGKLVSTQAGKELFGSRNRMVNPAGPGSLPSPVPTVNSNVDGGTYASAVRLRKRRNGVDSDSQPDTPTKKSRNNKSDICVGVGSVVGGESLDIPSVKKVIKKRIFVSRIDPSIELSKFATSVRTVTSKQISVIKMKSRSSTPHNRFSSFVIFAEDDDEGKLMDPNTWADGTMFKSFVGYLHPDQMESRFDTDVDQGGHIDGVPDIRTDRAFLRPAP